MNTNPMSYSRAATIASDFTGIPADIILSHIQNEGLAMGNILRAVLIAKQIYSQNISTAAVA